MSKLNQDTLIAIFLIIFCGIMIHSTGYIEDPGYQGMKASFWPTVILWLLSFMSLWLLVKSFYKNQSNTKEINQTEFRGSFFLKFKNASICFGMFILFLFFLDYLGMLLAGIIFVFGLLTFLGGISKNNLIKHFLISLISIGVMWSIFTFGLKVILPEGEIIKIW